MNDLKITKIKVNLTSPDYGQTGQWRTRLNLHQIPRSESDLESALHEDFKTVIDF